MFKHKTSVLTPGMVLNAYANGIFPMGMSANDTEIFWVDPIMRGIFPLNCFHVSRSLKRQIRRKNFDVRLNTCFKNVMEACADRPDTWINQPIFDVYCKLHYAGYGHSLEIFKKDRLIGGLYGIAIGAAFFGESMFSYQANASKIALKFMIDKLNLCKFKMFDVQFITKHLTNLGAIEIPRATYHILLKGAISETPILSIQKAFDNPYIKKRMI